MTSSLPLPVGAFVAGLVSFVTPCVLPLVPGYISLISGAGVEEIRRADGRLRRSVMVNAVLFVCGFTVVFMALGAVASSVGQLVQRHFGALTRMAGLVIIAFGLHKTELVPIHVLFREKRIHILPRAASPPRAFLLGFAFGFGWTPCVGPILAAILTFAASEATLGRGIRLLSLYSAGLALPFLLTALGIERFLSFYGRVRRHLRTIEVASGALMIALGALIFSRHFSLLNTWLSDIPVFRRLAVTFL